jgi:hypothetical protein
MTDKSKSDCNEARMAEAALFNVTRRYEALSDDEGPYVREITSFITGIVKSAISKNHGDQQSIVVTLPRGRFTISVGVRYEGWPTPVFLGASSRKSPDIKPTPSSTDTIS